MYRNNLIAFTGLAHAKPMRCGGDLGKIYRANPSAIAKIAARPAAIAAHALHWLCSYTKRRSNLGSSRPVPKPRFARLRFRNLTRADMNQRIAAAAAKVSERTSRASFMRVSRQAVKEGPKSRFLPFPCGRGPKNSLRLTHYRGKTASLTDFPHLGIPERK
jgi:hypothetical protein